MDDNLGIFTGVSFEEYEKIDALNGSSLVHMRKSPMHYRHLKDNPQPVTPAMVLGTATHRLILEPERANFAVWGGIPEHFTEGGKIRPRNGKDWDAFRIMHADKMIVTVAERDAMVGMAVGARRNAPIMKYAGAKGACEVTMVWIDPDSKRRCKGRMDKFIPKGKTIFDLKSCRNCSKYQFGKQSHQLGYHIKMAFYWQGYKTLTKDDAKLVIGAIENKAPYESAVYRINSDVLLQGLEDGAMLMKRLAECELSGEWPAAEPEEVELTLPTYAYVQDETDDLSELALVE